MRFDRSGYCFTGGEATILALATPPLSTPLYPQARLSPEELAQVQKLLYGWNAGRPVQALSLPPSAAAAAAAANFDLQARCRASWLIELYTQLHCMKALRRVH